MEKYLDQYDLSVIIPAKYQSSRIKNKNYIPFYKNYSLLDIKIKQIMELISPHRIFLFSENKNALRNFEKYEAHTITIPEKYYSSWPNAFDNFLTHIDSPHVLICFATTPFIGPDLIKDMADQYFRDPDKKGIITVEPIKSHLFDSDHRPINFGLGTSHIDSQNVKTFYVMLSGVSIIKKNLAQKIHYHVSTDSIFYPIPQAHVMDINDREDWHFCQKLLQISDYKKLLII